MALLARHCVHNFTPSYIDDKSPRIIEGVKDFEILCPISKVTGNRGNPLDLLRVALPERSSQFLSMILQEVPSIASDSRISDDDRIATLSYRLATGTPAENEQLTHQLMEVADVLFPKEVKDAENSIKFAASDVGVETPSDSAE